MGIDSNTKARWSGKIILEQVLLIFSKFRWSREERGMREFGCAEWCSANLLFSYCTVRLLSDWTALRIPDMIQNPFLPCHKVLGNAAVRSLNNQTVHYYTLNSSMFSTRSIPLSVSHPCHFCYEDSVYCQLLRACGMTNHVDGVFNIGRVSSALGM